MCDRSESGVVALFLKEKAKPMTQYELNRQISKQTGEPVAEIARRGFTIPDSTGFYVQLAIGFEGKIECGRMIV